MKKIHFAIATLLLFTWPCHSVFAQLHPSDDLNLKGKVKYLHTVKYSVAAKKSGKIKKEGVLDGGNAMSLMIYTPDGLLSEWYLGRLGQLKDSSWIASKGLMKYIYDKESLQLKSYTHELNNTIQLIVSYSYDESGRRIGEVYDDLDNDKRDVQCVFLYNDTLRLTVCNCYLSDGAFASKTTHRFDEKGNQIEYSLFMGGCCVDHRILIKYDDQNTLIEEKVFKDETQLSYTMTYEYQYDQNGNWVQRLEYINGKLKYLTERKFEYYH